MVEEHHLTTHHGASVIAAVAMPEQHLQQWVLCQLRGDQISTARLADVDWVEAAVGGLTRAGVGSFGGGDGRPTGERVEAFEY